MKGILKLSATASVLTLGLVTSQAGALSPGADPIAPEGLVHRVQKGDDKGMGGRGQEGGAKGATPGARDGGGKGAGPGSTQEKGAERRAAPDRGDRGAQRGTEGDRRTRGERGKAAGRTDIDVDVRGRRADRDRAERRTRIDIDVDRRRRARGRDGDVYLRGYGYRSGRCEDILRRYRQCVGR